MIKGRSEIQENNTDRYGRMSPVYIEKPLGNRDLSGIGVRYLRCPDGCLRPWWAIRQSLETTDAEPQETDLYQ